MRLGFVKGAFKVRLGCLQGGFRVRSGCIIAFRCIGRLVIDLSMYSGAESYLPQQKITIDPESSIFTISRRQPCGIVLLIG